MSAHIQRGDITLHRLEQALERLRNGTPNRTKNDGKINIKRINDEAGLSSGAIYYYKDFVERAKVIIENHKIDQLVNRRSDENHDSTIERLRRERDKEKELKVKYRNQRDKIKDFADTVVGKNAALEFALYEASLKISELEIKLPNTKVVDIKLNR